MSLMSENVGASTSHNPKGLHGLNRENFTFALLCYARKLNQFPKCSCFEEELHRQSAYYFYAVYFTILNKL
jgi:hypothetical protein